MARTILADRVRTMPGDEACSPDCPLCVSPQIGNAPRTGHPAAKDAATLISRRVWVFFLLISRHRRAKPSRMRSAGKPLLGLVIRDANSVELDGVAPLRSAVITSFSHGYRS
ncbi:MAG: hypothetical protein MPJ50_03700 [Pirellulales bacterium]|nr:hypothetical protein [Pirellulales bacterium]